MIFNILSLSPIVAIFRKGVIRCQTLNSELAVKSEMAKKHKFIDHIEVFNS
jgi:hypothetical protein